MDTSEMQMINLLEFRLCHLKLLDLNPTWRNLALVVEAICFQVNFGLILRLRLG